MSSELINVCFWAGYEGNRSTFRLSETQGGGLIREQFPPNTTPARTREPASLRWKQNYRVIDLLVNYVFLMFNLYF